jgi:hypothetical protein
MRIISTNIMNIILILITSTVPQSKHTTQNTMPQQQEK